MQGRTPAQIGVQPAVAAPAERVVARLRRHGRMLFWPTVLLLVVLAGAGYLAGRMTEQWQGIAVLSAAGLLLVVGFLMPLLSWLNRRYTITTRRVIVRHGFFVHVRQELLHSRGYDVSMRRSWLQSAFRSGDIVISTGPEQHVALRDVPNAGLVQSALHDLMEVNRAAGAGRTGEQGIGGGPGDGTVVWGQR